MKLIKLPTIQYFPTPKIYILSSLIKCMNKRINAVLIIVAVMVSFFVGFKSNFNYSSSEIKNLQTQVNDLQTQNSQLQQQISSLSNNNLDPKCKFEPESGSCKANIPRYYFNQEKGNCDIFY